MAKTNSSLRIKSAGNPFTKDKSLAAMKKRWSSMTPAQRKSNVENFRSAAKGKPKSQPAASKPKTTPKADPQRNTGSGRDGSFGLGTSGKGRPSGKGKPTDKPGQYNPQGKTIYRDKPKPKKTEVKGSRRRFQKPTRNGLGIKEAVSKAVKAVDKGLKLTYKKGDKKKVGGITYVHNGKRFVRYTV